MTNIILCDVTASISELKNDPVATASAGGGYPVAIIDRNRPVFIVPQLYRYCLMRWTKSLVQLITERQNQPLREVDLNHL
ncbi:type II toxin-antitoxin system Phd/YefM family antitoxin (plasmid) [Enterobacter hormaechei]|uniref:type II toxin-antitoxin system Phd/YefM family antitoxin n=1 Tax=Enterobacter hormaechei TaxID=158836 RepID=UPI0032C487AA